MSAPMDIMPTLSESGEPSQRPGSAGGGRSPANPPLSGTTPTRSGRRSIDGGSRRSVDGSGNRRGRHTVEVPEGAERHEGLVVSRQDKFGFIKCSTHEGRYFFHVNDSDGQAAYGSTVSFVIAKDLTTGKDVAYKVKTVAGPPNSPRAGGTPRASATGSGSTTPRRGSQPGALSAAEGRGFFASGAPSAAAALGGGYGNGTPGGEAAAPAAPTPSPQHQQVQGGGGSGGGGGNGGNNAGGQNQNQNQRGPSPQQQQHFPGQYGGPSGQQQQQYPGGRRQQGQGQEGQGPQQFGGQGQGGQYGGRAPYNQQYGGQRQPSHASSQADWRVPREPPRELGQGQMGPGGSNPGQMGPGGNMGGHQAHQTHHSRHNSGGGGGGGGAPADPSYGNNANAHMAAGPLPGEAAPASTYRGTVAQPGRAGRQHGMDDGLLLYIDEQGAQQQARYGNCRLAEGTHRLEAGDVVEFELTSYPGAGHGHRKVAADVRFLSKSLLPSPSLEAALAASESGDSMRGRQLGRVALLKKEFGFIRQMERPGDMFFHFSQLEGWGVADVKVGDDVEYTIRRDRDGSKLSAVQIRRAAPGSVAFETVGEELLRGVVLERPQLGKQYAGTSGILEYSPAGEEEAAAAAAAADAAGGEAAIPGAPGYGKSRLPFAPQDVSQGSGSLRVGDHVTFRLLTNLQAVRAAALASVPGAAAYAGKRAVEVTFVRYAGLVVSTNKERQFGFISYGEDQLLPPGPLHGSGTSGEDGEGEGAEPGAPTAAPTAAPAAPAVAPETTPPAQPAAAEGEAKQAVPAAPAAASEAAAAGAAGELVGSTTEVAAGGGGEGAGEAAAAASQAKRTRIFFHFKEVAGQYMLKQGDEVVFVLHSNLKSGELNAQRVRRTKEGPELPPPPEPAPKPAPVPAVNPNRFKYSGNLQTGGYRQPKIAKGPDGTRGFELPRPGAVMPPLPGLEPKPEEPEEDEEAAAAAAEGMDADAPASAPAAAPPGLPPPPPFAGAAVAASAVAPGLPASSGAPEGAISAASIAPGLSLAQIEARQAHDLAVKCAAAAVRAAPDGAPAVLSASWSGGTPFSAMAAMTLSDASLAEAEGAKLSGLSTHLSAEAPVFIPVSLSSNNLAGADEAGGSGSAADADGGEGESEGEGDS